LNNNRLAIDQFGQIAMICGKPSEEVILTVNDEHV